MIHDRTYKNIKELKSAVLAGLVQYQEKGDLILYKHTEKCEKERKWDRFKGTPFDCTGLILDKSGNVVALPYKKTVILNKDFGKISINLATLSLLPIQYLSKREDGILGIIYWHDGKWNCTTPDGFDSKLGQFAQNILNEHSFICGDLTTEEQESFKEYTILCEIIHPDNKPIVDYGNEEGLVLHGLVHTLDDKEFSAQSIRESLNYFKGSFLDGNVFLRIAEPHSPKDWNSFEEELKSMDGTKQRGFIGIIADGRHVAIDCPDYTNKRKTLSNFKDNNRVLKRFEEIILSEVKKLKENHQEAVIEVLNSSMSIIQDEISKLPEKIREEKINVVNDKKQDILSWYKMLMISVYPILTRFEGKDRWEAMQQLNLPEPLASVAMFYAKNPENKKTLERFFVKAFQTKI